MAGVTPPFFDRYFFVFLHKERFFRNHLSKGESEECFSGLKLLC